MFIGFKLKFHCLQLAPWEVEFGHCWFWSVCQICYQIYKIYKIIQNIQGNSK